MLENIESLKAVLNALNGLEVKGRNNLVIVIACMNDIERVIKNLRKEADSGNIHDEQQPEKA